MLQSFAGLRFRVCQSRKVDFEETAFERPWEHPAYLKQDPGGGTRYEAKMIVQGHWYLDNYITSVLKHDGAKRFKC